MDTHLLFAWSWIALGLVTGAWIGLYWAADDWLGGYASWPRRLIRLGHVAFVGTGLLNLGAHWTLAQAGIDDAASAAVTARALFVAGAVAMPLTCFAAAFHKRARHAFALPVAALAAGSLLLAHLVTNGA